MTEKAYRPLLALFLGILQLPSDWHFRADYDYEITSQSQGNCSQLFFTSLHCSRVLQDILMSYRCKNLLQKQVTDSNGKMNEFLRAQSGFCAVWVPLRNTKAKNNIISELEPRPFTLPSAWISNNGDSFPSSSSHDLLPKQRAEQVPLSSAHLPMLALNVINPFYWCPGPQRITQGSLWLPGQRVCRAEGFQSSRWECCTSHQA